MTNQKPKFTDVQVRIHNTAFNHKKAISISHKDLLDYVNTLRKSAKDSHGRLNWESFAHLPLVSFVDIDEQAEVVFKNEQDLPKKAIKLKTAKGTLLADIT